MPRNRNKFKFAKKNKKETEQKNKVIKTDNTDYSIQIDEEIIYVPQEIETLKNKVKSKFLFFEKSKDKKADSLIKDLQPMIRNIGDATVIVPLIAEYMDISVKNDDHLIKMAAIVQRAMARTASDTANGVLLTDEEKRQLLDTVNQIEAEVTTNG